MKPEIKQEKNITTPSRRGTLAETLDFTRYSSEENSDRKLPTAIENASIAIKIMPVVRIIRVFIPAIAMPESRPTVETKPSSTPKTKFLKYEAEENLCLLGIFLI